MEKQWILEVVLPILTGFIGWFFARRKNSAEAKRVEIENSDLVNVVLQKNVEMLQKQVSDMLNLVQELRKENLKLNGIIYDLQREMVSLKSYNNKLRNEHESNSSNNVDTTDK